MLKCFATLALAGSLAAGCFAQGWQCYGGNAQHSGLYDGTSQTAALIKWSVPLDDDPAYYNGEILAHYAAPMITPSNTVVHGFRFTTTVSGNPDYDNWRVIGRTGATGAQLWQMTTDYSAAIIFPNDWTTVFPITLFATPAGPNARGVAVAAAGGSLMVRQYADSPTSSTKRLVFYTTLSDFTANEANYAQIKINTPLTADANGNIYFGYWCSSGSPPSNLPSLGTGGIAKVNVNTGAATYVAANSLSFDTGLSRPAMSAAPALSADEGSIYVALLGDNNVLVKLSTSNLSVEAHTIVMDPSVPGGEASFIDQSSASPMVAPDGHVFMGVFGNQWRESHGWMLQFDGNLNPNNATGKTFAPGSFGWDDTAVVVPSNIVPSYKGAAKYLILTKYNNYDDNGSDPGADGSNKVAVLDPTTELSTDRQSGVPVMTEILTILGPTKTNDDSAHPNAVNEWCINSAAVDVARKGAIINSEDGHMYRWSFITNTLTEALDLEPPTGEAYTMTAIGPDGQIYVINNTYLFAIGTNKATSVSVNQGTGATGTVQSIWYLDGSDFSVTSVAGTNDQAAGVEADFALTKTNPTTLTVACNVTAAANVTGTISAYNYVTKQFVAIGTQALSTGQTAIKVSTSTSASQYIGPRGIVRILVQGSRLNTISTSPFTLALDLVTCGAS